MEKKKIYIIVVLCIIFIALISYCGIVLWGGMNQPTVYTNSIEGVGTFNTTNVTNFAYSDTSNNIQTDYLANDSITQVSVLTSTSTIESTIDESVQVNDSAGGHVIYKTTANMGDHKGEVRYMAILKDQDNSRYIMITSPTHELTSMMVDSFKFLEPSS